MKNNNWQFYVFHVTQEHYDFLYEHLGCIPNINDDVRLFLEMSFRYIDYEIGKYKHHIKCNKERLKEAKYGFMTPESIEATIEIHSELLCTKMSFRNELLDYIIKNKFDKCNPLVYPFMRDAGYSFVNEGISKEKCLDIFEAKIELLRKEIESDSLET